MRGGEHLELCLLVEGDVGHLLAGVEQRVLGGLGEHVLGRADEHGGHEGREVDGCQPGRQGPREQHEPEEGNARDQQHGGGDLRGDSPAIFAEDHARQQHHDERHSACRTAR